MKTNKSTISLTKEELSIIYRALTSFQLELMKTSRTWGNAENYIARGYSHDIWGQEVEKIIDLDLRVFAAMERIEKKDA